MTPASYVEKTPTYTAVQWDGSDESAAWILENYPHSTREADTITVQDALDRKRELPRDTWVVREDGVGPGGTVQVDPEAFARGYDPAG